MNTPALSLHQAATQMHLHLFLPITKKKIATPTWASCAQNLDLCLSCAQTVEMEPFNFFTAQYEVLNVLSYLIGIVMS